MAWDLEYIVTAIVDCPEFARMDTKCARRIAQYLAAMGIGYRSSIEERKPRASYVQNDFHG